jgi:hypothetical protein
MCASPRGAATAILAVSTPRIDAHAHLKEGYLRRFCRRRNFVRQGSRVVLADSPLKTELPGGLKGLNFGAHARQDRLEILQSQTDKFAASYTPTGLMNLGIRATFWVDSRQGGWRVGLSRMGTMTPQCTT